MRYNLVRKNKHGTVVLRTEYSVAEESVEQAIMAADKLDFSMREHGFHWDKVPVDEEVLVVPLFGETKEWGARPQPHDDAKVNWGGGGVSEEVYLQRMAAAGYDRERALALRKKIR
jgi:hypothetical protein